MNMNACTRLLFTPALPLWIYFHAGAAAQRVRLRAYFAMMMSSGGGLGSKALSKTSKSPAAQAEVDVLSDDQKFLLDLIGPLKVPRVYSPVQRAAGKNKCNNM